MIIVVLNDGETFTDITGCRIVEVEDTLDNDEIEYLIKNHTNHPPLMRTLVTFNAEG